MKISQPVRQIGAVAAIIAASVLASCVQEPNHDPMMVLVAVLGTVLVIILLMFAYTAYLHFRSQGPEETKNEQVL